MAIAQKLGDPVRQGLLCLGMQYHGPACRLFLHMAPFDRDAVHNAAAIQHIAQAQGQNLRYPEACLYRKEKTGPLPVEVHAGETMGNLLHVPVLLKVYSRTYNKTLHSRRM